MRSTSSPTVSSSLEETGQHQIDIAVFDPMMLLLMLPKKGKAMMMAAGIRDRHINLGSDIMIPHTNWWKTARHHKTNCNHAQSPLRFGYCLSAEPIGKFEVFVVGWGRLIICDRQRLQTCTSPVLRSVEM